MSRYAGDRALVGLQLDTVSCIANGTVGVAAVPIRESAIPDMYKWVTIDNMPVDAYIGDVISVIRATYARISVAKITAENATRVDANRLPVANAAYNPADATCIWAANVPTSRIEAIALGAVRAASYRVWGLTAAQLIGAEVEVSAAMHVVGAAVETIHATGDAGFTLEEKLAWSFANITNIEANAIFYFLKMAQAAVPLAGSTLFATGHHYLESTSLAHKGVMKQLRNDMDADTRAWFDANMATITDMVWHKAIHPINSAFLRMQAASITVPVALRQAGLGSAAVRLPYVEPEVKAAEAMLAVVAAVQEPITRSGGTLTADNLATALHNTKQFIVGGVDVVAPADHPGVVNRTIAIEQLLKPAMERACVVVAFSIGIYEEMLQKITTGRPRNSLMDAKSLTRVKANHVTSVASGLLFYENLVRMLKNATDAGEMIPPRLHD